MYYDQSSNILLKCLVEMKSGKKENGGRILQSRLKICSFGLSDFWKERKIREKKSLSRPTPFTL